MFAALINIGARFQQSHQLIWLSSRRRNVYWVVAEKTYGGYGSTIFS